MNNLFNSIAQRVSIKQQEIAMRGLAGFPVDETLDIELQARLRAHLKSLKGTELHQGPTTPLVLPVNSQFPANMLYYFLVGDYQQPHMDLIARYVKPGSRVLELGGGIGLTGSLAAMTSGNPVYACEPNVTLHPYLQQTFKANGCDLVLISAAAVSDDEPFDMTPFHPSAMLDDYWWSSMMDSKVGDPTMVEAIQLSTLIKTTAANTLIIDIEGYEVHLLSNTDCLAPIDTLFVEIHTPSIGQKATGKLITDLILAGFEMVDVGAQLFVFKRR